MEFKKESISCGMFQPPCGDGIVNKVLFFFVKVCILAKQQQGIWHPNKFHPRSAR